MPDSPSKAVSLMVAAVVAALVGAGTALVAVRMTPSPVDPVLEHRGPGSLEADTEIAALREKVNALQADLAEARLNLAAVRALPGLNPSIQAGAALADPDPELLEGLTEGEKGRFLSLIREMRARAVADAGEARAAFEEQQLRSTLGRHPSTASLDPAKLERLIEVLREGGMRIRALQEEAAAGGGAGDLRKRVETIGRETRETLQEFLTPAEVDAVDAVLSPPPGQGEGGR